MTTCDVELRNASKHFCDFVAVDRVDLQVEKGEFLTLLGPAAANRRPCG